MDQTQLNGIANGDLPGPGAAPKLTPEHVAAQVQAVAFHRFPGTTVTVCCITLRNGYNTIGHSACVSPENFNQEIGESIAYKNALNEIWQLEGYLLAEWLHLERQPGVAVPEGGGIKPVDVGSLGEPVAPHGHTAFAAAPKNDWPFEEIKPLGQNDERITSGGGGDYAGAGASGSWEAPTPSACSASPASDPPAASTGDSCSYSDGSGI